MAQNQKYINKLSHVVVYEVGVHVVDPVVHDGRGDIFAGDALGPSGGNVQVELGLAAVLARVLQVPLVLEQRVRRVRRLQYSFWVTDQVFYFERVVATLVVAMVGSMLDAIEISYREKNR